MSEATLNFCLFFSGIVGLAGTAGTLWFAYLKNDFSVAEKMAAQIQMKRDKADAKLQRALDSAKLSMRHQRIVFLQRENTLLSEKNHTENILHQNVVAELTRRHVEGKLRGAKSIPALIFTQEYGKKMRLRWVNSGEDDAEITFGSYELTWEGDEGPPPKKGRFESDNPPS